MTEDRYTEQERLKARYLRRHPFCVECQAEGRTVLATELDHVRSIGEGGSPDDDANLQGLCTEHHARKTSGEAQRGAVRARVQRARVRKAPESVLVYGPPCAGKSAWVDRCKRQGDVIIDLDALWSFLSGAPMHDPSAPWPLLVEIRDSVIKRIGRGDLMLTLWVIACAPTPDDRARIVGDRRFITKLIDPGIDECMKRAALRPDPVLTRGAIRKWYDAFLPG